MVSKKPLRQRKKATFRRIRKAREPYDVVLIVCEGEKTEPNYLERLRDEFRINSANIKVLGKGLDPLSIVGNALKLYELDKSYDRIYCVFDRDQHSTYERALLRVAELKQKGVPIFAITSVPCFEFWILLHFIDSAKPYISTGKKSAAN